MPEKLDYLNALADYPSSTAGEVAARLKVSEASAAQAYRRARKQGLVDGDSGQPQKFALTDSGKQAVRVGFASANGGSSASVAAVSSRLVSDLTNQVRLLQEAMNDLAEDVRTLFRFADKYLNDRDGLGDLVPELASRLDDCESEIAEIKEALPPTESAPDPNPGRDRVTEFHQKLKEFESNAPFFRRNCERQELIEQFEGEIGAEKTGLVRQLVEKELGSDAEGAAQLREQLGLPAGDSSEEGAEG